MADTLWRWKILFVVPLATATVTNRNALADLITAQGSGETNTAERRMFQTAVRLALVATPLVQAGWGVSVPVKLVMRDALTNLITSINSGVSAANRIQWYLLKNGDGDNELVASSRSQVDNRIGTSFTLQDVANDLDIVRMADVA